MSLVTVFTSVRCAGWSSLVNVQVPSRRPARVMLGQAAAVGAEVGDAGDAGERVAGARSTRTGRTAVPDGRRSSGRPSTRGRSAAAVRPERRWGVGVAVSFQLPGTAVPPLSLVTVLDQGQRCGLVTRLAPHGEPGRDRDAAVEAVGEAGDHLAGGRLTWLQNQLTVEPGIGTAFGAGQLHVARVAGRLGQRVRDERRDRRGDARSFRSARPARRSARSRSGSTRSAAASPLTHRLDQGEPGRAGDGVGDLVGVRAGGERRGVGQRRSTGVPFADVRRLAVIVHSDVAGDAAGLVDRDGLAGGEAAPRGAPILRRPVQRAATPTAPPAAHRWRSVTPLTTHCLFTTTSPAAAGAGCTRCS